MVTVLFKTNPKDISLKKRMKKIKGMVGESPAEIQQVVDSIIIFFDNDQDGKMSLDEFNFALEKTSKIIALNTKTEKDIDEQVKTKESSTSKESTENN